MIHYSTVRLIAFGYHDQTAPRHVNMSREMLAEGIQLVECHTTKKGLWGKLKDLGRKYRSLRKNADGVLVAFPGQALMPYAWLLTKFFPVGRPAKQKRLLMFDAFISLHDTIVGDRGLISRWNPFAWWLFFLDWISCHLADVIFVDTEEHKKFFAKRFGIHFKRIKVVYLGAREDIFHPRRTSHLAHRTSHFFDVFFYGSYIPLQGIEVILEAAKILKEKHPEIRFTLIGKGGIL